MLVVHDALKSPDVPYGAVVTLGNYDGIHRGQRQVIERVVARAKELGTSSALITFEPHPLKVLRPEEAPPLLTLPSQRERQLAQAGIDAMLIVKFTRDLARTPPEDFVRRFLAGTLAIEEIHVGRDFAFGHERRGNLALLEKLGGELGFRVMGVEQELHEGEVISSSRIRRAVREGRVELAAELLGRPYALYGTVVKGDRMGARLGWPTINLKPENEHLPAGGVYVGRVHFPKMDASFDCVTNIGTRPTVYENYQKVVESHILDFKQNVYGEKVEVLFLKRLREEKLFPSVMELAAQIGRDVESAREYFSSRRRFIEGSADSPAFS